MVEELKRRSGLLLHFGHPSTIAPRPPCAIGGGSSTKREKSCCCNSVLNAASKADFRMDHRIVSLSLPVIPGGLGIPRAMPFEWLRAWIRWRLADCP